MAEEDAKVKRRFAKYFFLYIVYLIVVLSLSLYFRGKENIIMSMIVFIVGISTWIALVFKTTENLDG